MNDGEGNSDRIRWELGERRKELAALHATARLLEQHDRPPEEVLGRVIDLLPQSWQYPAITEARIEFGGLARMTAGYRDTALRQTETFVTSRGTRGRIDVVYLEERPAASEGPFLAEERDLIRSLARILRAYFDHEEADAELQAARARLEEKVRERTADLRELARQLTLTEERQRREFARDLHDHLGQALAFIRMQLSELEGDVVLTGFETRIERIRDLLDRAIQYTRTLTAEISPPVLYELGLLPACEWLADELRKKHRLPVRVVSQGPVVLEEEATRVLVFLAVRELLVNAVKHAAARHVEVRLAAEADVLGIVVTDDGRGFDPARVKPGEGFGLFSVAERVRSFGGEIDIDAAPGRGTSVRLRVPRAAAGARSPDPRPKGGSA